MNEMTVIDGTYELPMAFDSQVVEYARLQGFRFKGGLVDHMTARRARRGETYDDLFDVYVVDAIRDIADEAVAWLNTDGYKNGRNWIIKDARLVMMTDGVYTGVVATGAADIKDKELPA